MSRLDSAGDGGLGAVTHVQQGFVKVNGKAVVVVGDQGTTHGGNNESQSGGSNEPQSGGYKGPGDTVPTTPTTPTGDEGDRTVASPAPDLHLEYQWRVSEGKSYITINGKAVSTVGSKCDCSHRIIDGENFVQIN